jgi:hypothetical protein
MTEDEREFEEWFKKEYPSADMNDEAWSWHYSDMRVGWLAADRTLKEKIKSE